LTTGFLAELGFFGAGFAAALPLTGVLDLAAGFAAAFVGFFSAVLAAFAAGFLPAAGDLLAGAFFYLPNNFASAFGLASLALAGFLPSLVAFSLDAEGFFLASLASFSSLAFFIKL